MIHDSSRSWHAPDGEIYRVRVLRHVAVRAGRSHERTSIQFRTLAGRMVGRSEVEAGTRADDLADEKLQEIFARALWRKG